MIFHKDPELRFNIDDPSSPHSIILKLVPHGSTVLDVGCNTGYIGEYLINKKQCICDGIDYNQEFLKKAKKKGYRNTYIIDLYNDSFKIQQKYDYILFIDILEHLPSPDKILTKFVKENLKKGGTIIICLPNIGRLEFRLKHLLGNFDYEKSGIMSQDHLRFFTKKTAMKMIKNAGLVVEDIMTTGLGTRIKLFLNLFSFQFIFICKK